ncbi:hypothetical protein CsSME_00007422 [Camellia sinensis var. sinensis]
MVGREGAFTLLERMDQSVGYSLGMIKELEIRKKGLRVWTQRKGQAAASIQRPEPIIMRLKAKGPVFGKGNFKPYSSFLFLAGCPRDTFAMHGRLFYFALCGMCGVRNRRSFENSKEDNTNKPNNEWKASQRPEVASEEFGQRQKNTRRQIYRDEFWSVKFSTQTC